jgi:hypothetical protein
MNRSLILALLALGPGFARVFCMDASVNVYAADRYYYRFTNDASAGRIQYDATVSGDVTSNLNVSFTFWGSEKMLFLSGGFTAPEEVDYQLNASWNEKTWSTGLIGNVYTPRAAFGEAGAYFDWLPEMPLELANLLVEAAVYSDFRGVYGEFKVAPGVSLPLTPIVDVTLPVTLSAYAAGFDGLSGGGLAGLLIAPRMTLVFSSDWNASLTGGYFLSLGRAGSSYPFVSFKLGMKFGATQ